MKNRTAKFFSLICIFTSILISFLFAGCAGYTKLTERDAPNMVTLSNWVFMSGVPNNEIQVNCDNADNFILTAENGKLWSESEGQFCKQLQLVSGGITSWHYDGDTDSDYVKIIQCNNSEITGYAVVSITKSEDKFTAKVLKSIEFINVNDKNALTETQIDKLIEQAKNYA